MKNIVFVLALLGFTLASFADEAAIKQGLSNESEAGAIITGGNTQNTTLNFQQKNTYKWDAHLIKFNGRFLSASSRGVEQAYLWSIGARYGHELSNRFSLFLGQQVESDKYQNLLQRYSTDLGGKYFITISEATKWFAETGYRFARENYANFTFKNISYLRLYTEVERSMGSSVSSKLWIEYLPNLTQWKAYQLNSELSLSVLLSQVFSVKAGYLLRYWNEPPAGVAFKTDTIFTTALVAKF